MQNKWEDFFEEKKHDIDMFAPDKDRIWRNVQNQLNTPVYSIGKLMLRVAVVLAIVFSVGILVRHELIMQQQLESLAAISDELAEKEQGYINKVNQKWTEYRALPASDNELNHILLDQLQLLDTIYQDGLKDIEEHGYNERAVLIMLDTYEKRLRIIERLIKENRKHERDENKSKHINI